ncbi:hypothetical protein D9758_008398 [Tetrapyrgos nigripes]|uniref:Uncharacterized protein n=1 Tax=Tetrapyrgos nigripes TaxID=182062 RepID=A0A8H5LN07_9AGAR|nr:hypothetical protein D9758_008398 [Tetrapyrgos nigripes]
MRAFFSVYVLGAIAIAVDAATIQRGTDYANDTISRRGGNPDQVLVEDIPQEGGDCNGHSFSFDHIVAQIQHAVVKWPEARVGPDNSKNPYPHPYTDANPNGVFVDPMSQACKDAKSSATMFEFPISGDTELYEGGPVNGVITERVMFRVDQGDYRQNGWNGQATVFYCAMGTHSGDAKGNQLADCGLYAGQ